MPPKDGGGKVDLYFEMKKKLDGENSDVDLSKDGDRGDKEDNAGDVQQFDLEVDADEEEEDILEAGGGDQEMDDLEKGNILDLQYVDKIQVTKRNKMHEDAVRQKKIEDCK